jgi:hypothetical protein
MASSSRPGHTSTAMPYFKKQLLREEARPPHALSGRNRTTTALPISALSEKENLSRSLSSKLSSFHNLLRIMFLLPSLRPALVRFHSAFQFLIRLQVIQTDHLIAARRWTLLFCKSIGT